MRDRETEGEPLSLSVTSIHHVWSYWQFLTHERCTWRKKKAAGGRKKKQVQYRGESGTRPDDVSISLIYILQIVIVIIVVIAGNRIDSWRGSTTRSGSATGTIRAPIGYGSLEDAKRPRSTLRCFSVDWKWGQATEWSMPCCFAPRLVAPNHNETCQGAYLRGHLKSDFYLRACRYRPCFALFSPVFFFQIFSYRL